MNAIKTVCIQNKFILITAALAVLCSEVLCTVMEIQFYDAGWMAAVKSFLRIVVMAVAAYVALNSGPYLSKYWLPFNSVLYVLLAVCSCRGGMFYFISADNNFYRFFSVFALLFLSLLGAERAIRSVWWTLLYIFTGSVYVLGTYDATEGFVALALFVLLFLYTFGKIQSRPVKIMHIAFGAVSLFALIALGVQNLVAYAEIRFLEGSREMRLLTQLADSLKAAGTAGGMAGFLTSPVDFNPARIFGFYGYIAGGILLLILAVFITGVFVKALENESSMKPLMLAAACCFAVPYLGSLFANCGVLCGMDVCMPFVCDNILQYFLNGFLLGLILAGRIAENEEAEKWKKKIILFHDSIRSTK